MLSEPSLDGVNHGYWRVIILGMRGYLLSVRSAFIPRQAVGSEEDAEPRSHQELRAFLRHIETNVPANLAPIWAALH